MRTLLVSTSVAALLVAGTSAFAADLRVRAPAAPAAAVMAPVYDWNGVYIGVQGGYAWSQSEWIYTATNTAIGDVHPRGGLIGGTLGYNWHTGPYVFGIEGDYAWARIDSSNPCPNAAFACRSTLDSFGTARVRAGMAMGATLLYATGGLAFGDQNVRTVHLPGAAIPPTGTPVNGQNKFQMGWTVGGGVEYGIAPGWSAKVEALYFDLNADRYRVDNDLLVHYKQTGIIVRGGINWRFNWGGGPVVAAY
jgi:outer membrane immunogenic protein